MTSLNVLWWLAYHLQPIVSPRWLERRYVAAARLASRLAAEDRPTIAAHRRILVDVTVIARHDAGTGIQRVVRSTLHGMRAKASGEVSVAAIRFDGVAFRHTAWPAVAETTEEIVVMGPGDVFLGLDMSLDAIRRNARGLLRWKRAGAHFWFVVYDLLPLSYPEHFSAKVAVRFRWWLTTIAGLADGFLCISRHTADDMSAVLQTRFGVDDVSVDVIPMGFDIQTAERPASAASDVLAELGSAAVLLAVGTLEPRKGYALLLDACERAWAGGVAANLVIVGRAGWKAAGLERRITGHPEIRRRLHWFPTLDDAGLLALYDRASALVAASYDEGFGLPVLEAIARGRPVLARDIPAFRVHAGHGLRYVPREADADQLAAAITDLLDHLAAAPPLPEAPHLPDWQATATAVLAKIG